MRRTSGQTEFQVNLKLGLTPPSPDPAKPEKTNRSAQPAIAASPVIPDAKAKAIAAESAVAPGCPSRRQPAAVPAPVVHTWLSSDQPGQLGNVQLRLLSVTLAPVFLRERTPFPGTENARGKSKEPLLSIVLEVLNLDPNRKLDYKMFGRGSPSNGTMPRSAITSATTTAASNSGSRTIHVLP